MLTTEDPFEAARLTIRKNFLNLIPNRTPYELKFRIEQWSLTPSGNF